jgi:hypothetical protein
MRLKIRSALVAGATAALLAGGAAPVAIATVSASASGATGSDVHCDDGGSAARVRAGSKGSEPAQDPNAKAYGRIKAQPRMANGSVHIPTVFHMIQSASAPSSRTNAQWTEMIAAQMKVLNDSFSGQAEPASNANDGSDTPFRFDLQSVDFTKNDAWYHVVPGKGGVERAMKKALYTGNSETLNVYAADIGGGLLGWAYFPQGYNNGRDIIDGVVMLDESMPGGNVGKYSLGDTLTHEVGHWLALHHTFQAGCSASNDFVVDTPKEEHPQFDCPIRADTCTAPGEDPIHNFMDYSQDSCMYLFTAGQAQRMNDAWIDFRAIP